MKNINNNNNKPRGFSTHRSIGQRLERARSRQSLYDTVHEWLGDWESANENLAIKQSLGVDISLHCLDTNTKRVRALSGVFKRLFEEIDHSPTTDKL